MLVVLTGAPGAGKGTQADLLQKRRSFVKLSTGDMLRKQIKDKTPLGQKVSSIMERGELVSDDILLEIVQAELDQHPGADVLLDGYPRNLNQAKTLAGLKNHSVDAAIHLDVDRDELIRRLSGRRVCRDCGASFHIDFAPSLKEGTCDRCGGVLEQRADDQPDRIIRRLEVYDEVTTPILDFYRERGNYAKVDGKGDTETVFSRLQETIEASRSS